MDMANFKIDTNWLGGNIATSKKRITNLKQFPYDPQKEIVFHPNDNVKCFTLLKNWKYFKAGTTLFLDEKGNPLRGERYFEEEYIPPLFSPEWETIGAVPKKTTFYYNENGILDLDKTRKNNQLFQGFLGSDETAPNKSNFGQNRSKIYWIRKSKGKNKKQKYEKKVEARVHYGTDIPCAFGKPIKASLPGVVFKVDYDEDYTGLYIVLRNSGRFTAQDEARDGLDLFICHISAINNMAADHLDQKRNIFMKLIKDKKNDPVYEITISYNKDHRSYVKWEPVESNGKTVWRKQFLTREPVKMTLSLREVNSSMELSDLEKNRINLLAKGIDQTKNIDLRPGKIIKQGDFLGLVGNSGYSFGAHLHIEYRLNINEGIKGLIGEYAAKLCSSSKNGQLWREVNRGEKNKILQKEFALNASLLHNYVQPVLLSNFKPAKIKSQKYNVNKKHKKLVQAARKKKYLTFNKLRQKKQLEASLLKNKIERNRNKLERNNNPRQNS